MREKRDEIIILRTTKAEKNRIYEKMLGMGIRSLSAYMDTCTVCQTRRGHDYVVMNR